MSAYSASTPARSRITPPASQCDGDDFGLGIHVDLLSPRTTTKQPAAFTFDLTPPVHAPHQHEMAINTSMLSPDFALNSPSKMVESVDSPMMSPHGSTFYNVPEETDQETLHNPFNFTTQQYSAGRQTPVKADLGRRKGHKYKHSSISHQIFQSPVPRPALQLPTSLPMPTRQEVQHSLSSEQKGRLAWCLCHFAVAGFVQWSGHGSLSLTALSRLLFFDASGAVTCVFVDLMGNFEVWNRSSLRHPFGLERVDVLAGFGLAVFIGFMGLDVLSHGIEHSLENTGSHVPHTAHGHSHLSSKSVNFAAMLAIGSTLVSALVLRNHARIGKAMRFGLIAGWGKVLGNPSHVMTLSCSALVLLLPFLSAHQYTLFDTGLSAIVALAMIAFGVRLGTSLASMLLMSYSGPGGVSGVKELVADIEADPLVGGVEDARFWRVHYGLGMASLKVHYQGKPYGDDLVTAREKIARLIRSRLGSESGLKWEITTQLVIEGN